MGCLLGFENNNIEMTLYSEIFYNCTNLRQVIFPPKTEFSNYIDIFYNCCKNDYIDIVEFLLKNNTIQNINNEITTISKENDKMYTIKEFLLFHKVLHICVIKQLYMFVLKMAI